MEYLINTGNISSASTLTYSTGSNVYVTPSVATWTTNPAPRPPSPLEWLDGEIERTCAAARTAA